MQFLIPCFSFLVLLVQQSKNDMIVVEMGREQLARDLVARPVSFTLIMIWIIEIHMWNDKTRTETVERTNQQASEQTGHKARGKDSSREALELQLCNVT